MPLGHGVHEVRDKRDVDHEGRRALHFVDQNPLHGIGQCSNLLLQTVGSAPVGIFDLRIEQIDVRDVSGLDASRM